MHVSDEIINNLPRQKNFIGRNYELDTISEALNIELDRAWIISLVGVGGIGKTELAIQVAHNVAEKKLFKKIIWTTAKDIELIERGIVGKDYTLGSLDDLLNSVINALKLDKALLISSTSIKKEKINKIFRESECLLIVDNLETIDDYEIINFLTRFPPGKSKVLVTSRIGGEIGIGGVVASNLTGAREIRIGPMNKQDSTSLLVQRISERGLNISDELISKAVEEASGIPLAVEWIVGQIALGANLEDVILDLSSSGSEVLGYCFDNLIKAVGERAKKLFLAISLFPQAANIEVLENISQLDSSKIISDLRRLTGASLVEQSQQQRYFLLAPTKMLANSLWLDVIDLQQKYYYKMVSWYHRYLLRINMTQKWLEAREHEHFNILQSVYWCYEQNFYDLVVEISEPLSEYLQRIGDYTQRTTLCEIAKISAASIGNKVKEITFSYDMAEIYKHIGELDRAYIEFEHCFDLSSQLENPSIAMRSKMQMGIVLYHKDEISRAISIIKGCLDGFETLNERFEQGLCHSLLGRAYLKQGKIEDALSSFKDSQNIKSEINDQLGIGIGEYDLGNLYFKIEDYAKAETYFKDSISRISLTGDQRHLSNAKYYYAQLKINRGDYTNAKKLLHDSLVIEQGLQRKDRIDRNIKILEEISQ